ncbi:MAG: ABC transporter permease subunit [Clostridia bacterium]|nr:ABC transporter permease subunit [Clostridia bacterium]
MTALAKKRSSVRLDLVKLLLAIIFILLCLLPLARMLFFIDKETLTKVVSSESFGKSVLNTLLVGVTATAISVTLALLLSFSLQRTKVRGKSAFSMIFCLPMLIPSISIGWGMVILFGTNGVLTRLFSLENSIYGFWGIVIGSVIYAFPVAFLMLNDVLKYEDGLPYEAAEVLGFSKWRRTCAITIPYLKRPLISAIFATFTMIVTDYGVPLVLGGKFKTMPVLLYENVTGSLDFAAGSVIGVFLLVPAVVAFLFDLFSKSKGNTCFVPKPMPINKDKIRDAAAYLLCGAVALASLIFAASFLFLAIVKKYPRDLSVTFDNFVRTFELGGSEYLVNSLIIALCTSVLGVVVAFITAYFTARVSSKTSRFLHLMSITSLAIPGMILGLSYSLTFNKTPIYGTIAILILVNTMHFFASPYLMAYNSMSKMNENLENVGETIGVSRWRIIKDVILPQSRSTLIEAFAYFFVNCMMTISAVSILTNTSTKPISLMINQFEAHMAIECAAVVSLLILVINLLMKGTVLFCQKRFFDRKPNNTP